MLLNIPPFTHYVVLRDMKAVGTLYYRGQVIQPQWDSFLVQNLVDVKYIAPVPGDVPTVTLDGEQTGDGTERMFVNETFAVLAEKQLRQRNGSEKKAPARAKR